MPSPDLSSRRGLTVLALVLLIIALAVGGYLVATYLIPSAS
jgi:signal peptidase I